MSQFADERHFAEQIVAEACRIARRVQHDIATNADSIAKNDRSPVTVADLAVQTVVSHRLKARYPDDPLLAEEDVSQLQGSKDIADRVLGLVSHAVPGIDSGGILEALGRGDHGGGSGRHWVLDPIDGTKGFLRGDQYAVALALVVGGRVVVGVLGCPNLGATDLSTDAAGGTLYSAALGQGTTMAFSAGGEPHTIRVDRIDDPAEARFCESVEAAHAAHSDQARIADLLGITLPSARIDSQCKYAVVARGDASIYLRLPRDSNYREKVWDHAAGVLVIEEAGGRVSDLDGHSLDFSQGRYLARSHGIVATNGHLHDRVLEVCRVVRGLE
jgi:3'(2'), 5'-bisphosphate nucleotidase